LVLASADGTISLWETVITPEFVSRLTYSDLPLPFGTVSCLAVLPTGLLVSGGYDSSVAVWRIGYKQPSTVT
jgi:WD40 repeat protein